MALMYGPGILGDAAYRAAAAADEARRATHGGLTERYGPGILGTAIAVAPAPTATPASAAGSQSAPVAGAVEPAAARTATPPAAPQAAPQAAPVAAPVALGPAPFDAPALTAPGQVIADWLMAHPEDAARIRQAEDARPDGPRRDVQRALKRLASTGLA